MNEKACRIALNCLHYVELLTFHASVCMLFRCALMVFLISNLYHIYFDQIVHSLSRAVHVDARLGRLEERSRNVQINDESLCDSCHARLGTKLFAMYPDDSIVCYKVG